MKALFALALAALVSAPALSQAADFCGTRSKMGVEYLFKSTNRGNVGVMKLKITKSALATILKIGLSDGINASVKPKNAQVAADAIAFLNKFIDNAGSNLVGSVITFENHGNKTLVEAVANGIPKATKDFGVELFAGLNPYIIKIITENNGTGNCADAKFDIK